MDWAKRRKTVYALSVLIVLIIASLYVLREVILPTPTCSDGKQNGYETGVDCGGECSLRCSQDIIPLTVIWARALKTSSTTYDLAALVSNKNIDNAPVEITYTFIAYDSLGQEMARIQGVTAVPIDGNFPIVQQNIVLQDTPSEVGAIVSSNISHYKVLEKPTSPTLRTTGTRYEAGSIPRVYATLSNTKRIALRNVPVRALLYDADGNVFAAGQTIIPLLDKESSQEVVFTWDRAFSVQPTRIQIFPILDPFLGSL